MLASSMEILVAHPVRKTKAQKQAFRETVRSYAQDLGYETAWSKNALVIGNAMEAPILLAAGNASSGVLVLLEILRFLPENRRDRAAFLLTDGLVQALKGCQLPGAEHTLPLILYLDTVGEGDRLRIFPTKQLNQDRWKLTSLYKACGYFGKKSLLVQEKFCLPWYMPASCGAVLCAVNGGKKETYRSRPRTDAFPALDPTNLNILRAGLISYITCTE